MSLAMEALAINYMSHGVLNSVWAWIAFLTAALSFWKFKSSTLHLLSSSSSSSPHASVSSTPTVAHHQELPSTTTPSSTSSTRLATFCTLENRRSGKFSVYYDPLHDDAHDNQNTHFGSVRRKIHPDQEEDERMIMNNEEEERILLMKGSMRHRRNQGEEITEGTWEAVLKMKTCEMEWYRYQDLTVLNGNVVRLWNEIITVY